LHGQTDRRAETIFASDSSGCIPSSSAELGWQLLLMGAGDCDLLVARI